MSLTSPSPGQQPLIRRFALELANGYKDIEFSTDSHVKILVAENGAGKTTLFNALHAVLTGNHSSLVSMEFSTLQLEIGGHSWKKRRDEFSIASQEYDKVLQPARWLKLDLPIPTKLEAEELIAAIADGEENSVSKTKYFARDIVQMRIPPQYIKSALNDILDKKIQTMYLDRRQKFLKFSSEVAAALAGYTVLYLPTYRRIEASLPEYQFRTTSQRHRRIYKNSWATDQLIHFGLQDVESKLFEMAEEIRRSTVQAFSSINGRTLDDLLFGHYKQDIKSTSPIDAASLQVVLGRLGRDNPETKQRIERLINSGEINNEDNIYLKSFLNQLLQTYISTQDREARIENFIRAVNSYWDEDGSEKKFEFDKASAEARVVNFYTGGTLPLEALSSGEKQIISIFARLYLEPEQKIIVLIDEPELSLSMEWQQKFLPDIARAPSCSQLIAITHSPFIFKNELRPFAGPITVRRHKTLSLI
ncbi:AAA family ATPase [Roseomonas frigidaquae]|uniref:AAA family ATPase n=1 Tax=Falsiroseomonas frigidaquae TaxID=487318 RepID=A0ABX1ETQ7_9PROT|nr:AAA family ATPase [Falsiroseomonas frigidaquae]NKE43905.1 AAA family ATPase [Falsiroseomonas frigidaquae]